MANNKPPLWVILTPIVRPAAGGAAIYADLLASALAQRSRDVVLISEQFPGAPAREQTAFSGGGQVTIERVLPFRAGRDRIELRAAFDYARSAIMLAAQVCAPIEQRMREADGAVCLVHSSLIYRPTPLVAALNRLKRRLNQRLSLIYDVRDPLAGRRQSGAFNRADYVIASSKAVQAHLAALLDGRAPIHLPIPFEAPAPISAERAAEAALRHNLRPGAFVFSPNGISRRKGHGALRDGVLLARSEGLDVTLAVAGRRRDWSALDESAAQSGGLRYLGSIPHEEVLSLMSVARLVAIPSPVEAPSRAALEAVTIGASLLAPPVEEFRTCSAQIAASCTRETLAKAIAAAPFPPVRDYDFSRHALDVIATRYIELEPGPAPRRRA